MNAIRAIFHSCAPKGADAVFTWIERAYARRDSGITHMKFNWQFQPAHGDRRWEPLLEKLRWDG